MEENGRIDMSRPTVEMKNIVKMFGSFKANDGINLTVHKGEIHAILGENGAGKSTLMNILYGLYHPTSGQIFINGKEVSISGPNKAIELGIGMVHQHFMLVHRGRKHNTRHGTHAPRRAGEHEGGARKGERNIRPLRPAGECRCQD